MALYKACDLLRQAEQEKRCVVSFTTFNLESIQWAIEVAEEEKTPIIIMYYYPSMDCGTHAAMTRYLAGKAEVPVGYILDHSHSYFEVLDSIRCGLTSVMFDGSKQPYEDNVAQTIEVVKAAHILGVDVEGELGYVGQAKNLRDFTDVTGYTDPDQAVDFVARTGVDALAVAIGNAHGNYAQEPKLDLRRLEMIRSKVEVPIALHGGTGIPAEQLREAVRIGVSKLNVGTAYNQAFYDQYKDVMLNEKSGNTIFEATRAIKEGIKEEIRGYLRSVQV